MARAVRRLAASFGVDPGAHGLVAFGGAGPAHACGIAERLGIDTVVVPFLAGAFSAVGIGAAARRAAITAPVVGGDVARARSEARARLPFPGNVTERLALRFVGTSTVLEAELDDPIAAFHRAHRERFGFERDGEIEALEIRLTVEEAASHAPLRSPALPRGRYTVRAWFDGTWGDHVVAPMDDAHALAGPALLSGHGTTVVVDRGWTAESGDGFLRLTRAEPRATSLGRAFHPVHTAVFATRLTAIAEQMGERLQSLARSTSIRERRDFSCAVFDREGRLCASAPHVPVHLGAMGETVRRLASEQRLADGETWVTNDPYAGGSHLPDVTVIRPVFARGERIAFVACRGHHVDVGGATPGSMPPFSARIDEEGFVLPAHRLVAGGVLFEPGLPVCREPEVVRADLRAQASACELGHERVQTLEREVGDAFAAQLDHLRERARRAVLSVLATLGGEHSAEEVFDDGTRLSVELRVDRERARIAIRGPAHRGNLNAPAAVARAAILYVLRLLVEQDLPLNEGALDPFEITLERDGLFDPRPPRAVAGGNVETSQRLVDALLRAVGALASSQGTMNNLTVGTSRGAWYETIGGGAGAGPTFDGASAVQVHMTNTRATDVEELETRFPVLLERFARWPGSGGAGRHPGGDGTEKVWRFLEAADVALLAGRRTAGAAGLEGGGAGAPGRDERDVGNGFEPAPAVWRAEPGQRLRIRTPGGGGFGATSPSGR
jgi:5-oxoprolinase (ATP-hydrolysing)